MKPPSNRPSSPTVRLRDKHKKYLFPGVINYYETPVVLTEGKGLRIRDADGNEYLDFFGGILTVSIGHADDRVNAAIIAQISRLAHVSTLYPTLPIVELAETARATRAGRHLADLLHRLRHRGRRDGGDAGAAPHRPDGDRRAAPRLLGPVDAGAVAHGARAVAPVPTQVAGVKHAPAPYCYRCPLELTYPSCGVACAKDIEELIRTTTTGRIAGFIAEPIQGVGGFITPPPEYFQIAVDIVRKYGGVFICDEVQTGFGRTGGKMWGIEHWGVEPDIMTMAKGIANGMPLGVTIATPEIAGVEGADDLDVRRQSGLVRRRERDDRDHRGGQPRRRTRPSWGSACARARGAAAPPSAEHRRRPRHGPDAGLELVEDEVAGDRTPAKAVTFGCSRRRRSAGC